jgi:hypothetical protein
MDDGGDVPETMNAVANPVCALVLLRSAGAELLQHQDEHLEIAHAGQQSLFVAKLSPKACHFSVIQVWFRARSVHRHMLSYDRGSID